MHKVLLLVVSLSSCLAAAQNTPWFELYGGYQYARTDIARIQDLADSLTVPAGVPRINVGRNLTMNGWNLSVQENAASWWGGIIDFSGSYATKNVDLSQAAQALGLVPFGTKVVVKFQPTFYTFAIGPQLTYRKISRLQPFVHIMLGDAYSDLRPDSSTKTALKMFAPTFKTSDNAVAVLGGGGLDYVFNKYAAFRLTGDYIRSDLYNGNQNNYRVSAGIDFRIRQR